MLQEYFLKRAWKYTTVKLKDHSSAMAECHVPVWNNVETKQLNILSQGLHLTWRGIYMHPYKEQFFLITH